MLRTHSLSPFHSFQVEKDALARYDKDGNGKLEDAEIAAIKPKKDKEKAKK